MRSADSPLRLRTPARAALAATIGALVASGVGWLAANYAPNVDDLRRLAIEAWMLKLHGAAAFAMLFAVGAMSAHHVRCGWLLARNRASGIVVIASVAILIATGYALYYLVTDATRPSISIVHWIVGLAFAPILIVHLAIGRRMIARGNGHRSGIKRKAAARPSAR